MKRFTLALAALFALVSMFPAVAQADGVLAPPEALNWRFPGATATNEIAKKVIAASVSDTTTWAITTGINIPVGQSTTYAATDSLALARFVVYVDTSYSVPQGSFTVTLQGSWGDDTNLFTAASFTINPTTGTKFFTVPVYYKSTGLAAIHPDGWARLPHRLRLVVSNAGTAWAGCRVDFQKLVGK